MKTILLMGVAVTAAAIASTAIAQPGGGRPRITFYEGPNFTGRSVTYDRDFTNLPRQYADMALSVRVQGAWSVCVDSDYRGRCVVVDRDVRDLRSIGMGRTISSMRLTRGGGGYPGGGGGYPGRASITLYDGPGFTGRARTFDSDFSNLPREFNDTAGSARVQGRWTVCVDSDYRGRCVELDRDIRDLRSIGMDRTISSLRSGAGGGYPGGGGGYPGGGGGYPGRASITLYDGPGFTGRARTFDSDFTNLPREFNDTAGSMRVQGRWTICVDSNYGGRCVDVDRDIRDLRSIGMDRTISSIRIDRYRP